VEDGGGGIWQTGSYDPRRTSTSSAPATRIRSTTRSSVRATTSTRTRSSRSNVETGKLAWYFQYTPNDSWDFDEVGVHMLYDVTIDGATRKVVGHFARNGFFYTLDRTNGSSSRPRSTSTI
jgi:alcohol dehydrogenase (cytochrome c)